MRIKKLSIARLKKCLADTQMLMCPDTTQEPRVTLRLMRLFERAYNMFDGMTDEEARESSTGRSDAVLNCAEKLLRQLRTAACHSEPLSRSVANKDMRWWGYSPTWWLNRKIQLMEIFVGLATPSFGDTGGGAYIYKRSHKLREAYVERRSLRKVVVEL